MERNFSKSWKSSKKPSKQRKYRYNAPLHIKQKFMHVHLSKDLRNKYTRRSIGLRKEDKVKVLRGEFKGHTGKVTRIDVKHTKVYVEGVELTKKDGTKVIRAIEPSNLMILELALDDKMRQNILSRKRVK